MSAYTGPVRSKIDTVSDKLYAGAWIPKTMDKSQWIEARFDHPEYVNAIVTKGREGSNQWVKSFMVAYSMDGKTFHYYEETPGTPKIFNGNFDGDTEARALLTPVIAKYVRIQPLSWEGAIALRFSIIGCRAPETTVAPSTGPYHGPTASPGHTGPGVPTAAPQQTCLTSTWSNWINKNSNHPDGDFESMTKEELAAFCPVGKLKVECETVDGIKSYSTGEDITCTAEKGLICRNADNLPIPCNDYKIRYHCNCSGIPTASPGHGGPGIPTSSPGHTGPGVPTVAPQQTCLTSTWSNWINRNTKPGGDYESMTKEELAAFCPVGKVKVECKTVDGIAIYSTGEQATCTAEKGLICNDADNIPISCNDYKIRYHCNCSGIPTASPGHFGPGLPTASPGHTGPGVPTVAPQQTCLTSTWSNWINRNTKPGGDYESMTKEELAAFCPVGKVKVECETVDGIAIYSTGEQATCTAEKGLICNDLDNLPVSCNDYKIRYHCNCSGIPTASPGHGGQGLPTASPGHTGPGVPTAAPQQTCLTSTWSNWINRNTKPGGDYESMTKEELAAFCPVGKVKVECETVDGIAIYSTGEQATCTAEKGLICNDLDNLPVSCNDYKIRYHCNCSGIPTASPGHMGPGIPTASPPQTGPGGPTASPVVLTAMPTPNIPSGCKEEMGMKSGFLRNDMLSASSYRDGIHSPYNARLGGFSAWLPATQDKVQYIQVNFLAPRIITGIITQGRPDAPSYVTSYKVYFSYDGTNWSPYREIKDQDKIFSGNFDNTTPVTNTFMTPVRAQYIRISPQTWSGMIAMRFEIQGCFESYPTVLPPTVNPHLPTASPTSHGGHPTASPPPSQHVIPPVSVDCIDWDKWVDIGLPTLTSKGDHEPISEVIQSSTCKQPMSIECRTATPQHTPSDKTGQKVSCNLWEGLVCNNADQSVMCFNYEVRLGCLKQTQECLSKLPTVNPSLSPQLIPGLTPNVIPCYTGMDLSKCPKNGCQAGYYCDGLKCVTKSECPCLIDGKVVRSTDITQNSYCDTCQCISGEVKCIPKTCPPCQQGLSTILDKTTCQCQCQACAVNEYQCGNGHCIPQAAKCDGVSDCTTDEFECMSTPMFTIPGTPTPKPTLPYQHTPTASPQLHSFDPLHTRPTPSFNSNNPSTGPVGNDLHKTSIKVVTTGIVPSVTDNLPPHGPTPTECATVTCNPLVTPPLKQGETTQIVKTKNGCCEEYLVICEPRNCPAVAPNCMKPEVVTQVSGGDRCCPDYTCVCPPKCPQPVEPPCAYGSQVVEIVIGCNCTTKACVAGTPMPYIAPVTTPPPPICRYTVTKKIENGKEVSVPPTEITHVIGESWTDGLCKSCQCVNTTHGTPETSCRQQQCPACKLGEERRTKLNTCCGECVKVGCVVNGTVYKDGDKIHSTQKCFEMMCTTDIMTREFMLQQTQVQCEHIDKLPKCTGNENTYDATGCCLRCVPAEMLPTNSSSVCQSCTPRLMFGQPHHSVSFFKVKDNGEDCSNVDPVADLKECSGYCGSSSQYTHIMRGFDNKCQCCQPATTVSKSVELLCTSGRKITKTYNVPETCGCKACSGGA